MLGRYPVTIGGETRGELQVSKDGAVWLFEAEAEDPGGLLRLSVYGEGREGLSRRHVAGARGQG